MEKKEKKMLLSGLEDENVYVVEKLFRMDIMEFCHKLVDLDPKELLTSMPINIMGRQFLFVISKPKKNSGSCVIKFCEGPSFTNKVLKVKVDRPSIAYIEHSDTFVGTVMITGFVNQCLTMNGVYDVEYKAFKGIIDRDALLSMIQEFAFGDDRKSKTLMDHIKFSMKEKMMNAYSMIEGVRG